ncbi:MAG: hypothetical protein V7L29_31500 [Nostoc sp.]|uniref:hypothetical protein n=1 Tax=Nostoc sp. TaxID=1180 RepID=UPI002FF5D423
MSIGFQQFVAIVILALRNNNRTSKLPVEIFLNEYKVSLLNQSLLEKLNFDELHTYHVNYLTFLVIIQ